MTAPGEAVLIVAHDQRRAPRGQLAGQRLRFVKARHGAYVALSAIDLEASTGPVRLRLDLEGKERRPYLWSSEVVVSSKAFPMEKLEVEGKYVRPPVEDERRAEKEARLLKRLFAEATPKPLFSGAFSSPIPGAMSARFGERRVFNGVPKAPHTGADLRAKAGEPVRAPAGGRVVLAEDLFYSGNTVILDHGLGLYTLYAHLSRIDVKHGQTVKRGQRLGLVGATGRVTGPHLHWAARLRGARVDPYSLTALPLGRYL